MTVIDPSTRCTLCGHREDQHDTEPDGKRPCRSVGHPKGVPCAECRRLTSAEHVKAIMELRHADDEAFAAAWSAFHVTLDHVRSEIGEGWQAFFTDVHQSALASAVLVLQEHQPKPSPAYGNGVPGDVVDGILCDASTVAEVVADGLQREGNTEGSKGARTVMTQLHSLAGCEGRRPPQGDDGEQLAAALLHAAEHDRGELRHIDPLAWAARWLRDSVTAQLRTGQVGNDFTEEREFQVVGDWGVSTAHSAEDAHARVARALADYPSCGARAEYRIVRTWDDDATYAGPWQALDE